MPFEFEKVSKIPDLIIIKPRFFLDERGWFLESFKESEFLKYGISENFVQDNHSFNEEKGVVRGLHFQLAPYAQGKLVRCIAGKIFDVVVDIRKKSKTYGTWFGVELSAQNHMMLWIPPGFAHGYCTLTQNSEVLYKQTQEYHKEAERIIRWNDPKIGITWSVSNPIISERDKKAPLLADVENNFC